LSFAGFEFPVEGYFPAGLEDVFEFFHKVY
jgi:hypothetical protein